MQERSQDRWNKLVKTYSLAVGLCVGFSVGFKVGGKRGIDCQLQLGGRSIWRQRREGDRAGLHGFAPLGWPTKFVLNVGRS
ncbi:hypothetical protein [Defluviicoccus vanus]|uniref:hypothetical protein n=1 Tax=Defluviicoccus vanus TaxID=111831 RepID=UPI001CBA60DB|nr:hypothetical protein [Defluviicoccus vanus]